MSKDLFKQRRAISLQDWDALVRKTYGKPYDFQQQDGCKQRETVHLSAPWDDEDYENDTIPEEVNGEKMGVSFKAWLARDPQQKIADGGDDLWRTHLWWSRNFYPRVGMIINDLHSKGILPEGDFSIEIDW